MHNLSTTTVIKASGTKEPFSEEKITKSLSTSGLSQDTTHQAVDYLKSHLEPSISTSAIFGYISSYLRKNAPQENYYNYGLKRAVKEMGPSGYPFEILISDLLKTDNYKTEVGVITQGKCVTHEVDVIAEKQNNKFFIECKYHNSPGYKTDIQVALYTYARFLDIENAHKQLNPDIHNFSWLITNTKVTTEVQSYGNCVGLKITTWTHPERQGLQDLIQASRLHPVTLLYRVPQTATKILLERGIVTCSRLKTAILNNQVNDILTQREKASALDDINNICKSNE